MLADLSAVDYLGQEPRFEVVYHLNSLQKNIRIRIKTPVSEGEEVDTVVSLWPNCELVGARSLGYVWNQIQKSS